MVVRIQSAESGQKVPDSSQELYGSGPIVARRGRAHSPGASFQACIRIGKFHGMICPMMPTGSWRVKEK
jgi:hypothetical protein